MAIERKKVKFGARERRKLRIRKKVQGTDERPRISVFRSVKYTYAQMISDETQRTLVSASTQEKEVLELVASLEIKDAPSNAKSSKSVLAARAMGRILAKRAQEKNLAQAVFDRNGYVYTGRLRAVADGMREAGFKI